MKCMICKTEVTDKRRKKCPICGSKLSLSKYDNHIFEWSDNDIKILNDARENSVSSIKKPIEKKKKSTNKQQTYSSIKENKQSVNVSKTVERKKDGNKSGWYIAGGAFLIFTCGINYDVMPLPSMAVLGISATILVLLGFSKLFKRNDK